MSTKILTLSCTVFLLLATVTACRKAEPSAPASGAAAAPAATPTATPPSAQPATAQGTGTPPPAPAAPDAPAAPAVPTTKPVPAKLPDVVARVNDEAVTRANFERLLRNVEASNGPVPSERRDEILRKVLDELITYTMLKQEAATQKIAITDAEVEVQVNAMRQQAKSEANFIKALETRKMTLAVLRADARTELAIARLMNQQVSSLPPATDADAKAFYDANPDRFKREEAVRASHILIRVEASADEATKAQARTKIEAVLKRAKAGEDFAALARENSQDGSAPQGGDLNFFPKQKMVPEFATAAFALKTGDVSDVVTTQFGYHIIKVTDRRAAGTVPLEEVTPQVKEFLTQQKKQEQAKTFIAGLRQKSKIEVLI